jgi:hypothetical protein
LSTLLVCAILISDRFTPFDRVRIVILLFLPLEGHTPVYSVYTHSLLLLVAVDGIDLLSERIDNGDGNGDATIRDVSRLNPVCRRTDVNLLSFSPFPLLLLWFDVDTTGVVGCFDTNCFTNPHRARPTDDDAATLLFFSTPVAAVLVEVSVIQTALKPQL